MFVIYHKVNILIFDAVFSRSFKGNCRSQSYLYLWLQIKYMAKVKSAFFCQNCGHETPKWLGKCPSCSEWNTFVEELIQKQVPSSVVAFSKSERAAKPQSFRKLKTRSTHEFYWEILNLIVF